MQLEYPIFPPHTTPHGCLPKDIRAQACWYFYILAQKQKELAVETEKQIILEGADWCTKRYINQKRAVALLYGLDDPDELDKFWEYVTAEIIRFNSEREETKGLPLPAREYMYVTPLNFRMKYNEN